MVVPSIVYLPCTSAPSGPATTTRVTSFGASAGTWTTCVHGSVTADSVLTDVPAVAVTENAVPRPVTSNTTDRMASTAGGGSTGGGGSASAGRTAERTDSTTRGPYTAP